MGGTAVGVLARRGERPPQRERRLPRDGPLAHPDRREQPGPAAEVRRRRLDGGVEREQAARPDPRTREDRDRLVGGRVHRRGAERVAPAPRPVRAQRRQLHRVGLRRQRAPAGGHLGPREEGVERGLVVPDGEHRPPAQIGAQRHRLAAARPEQAPEAQPGHAPQRWAIEARPRQSLGRGRAGVAGEVEGGEESHGMEYAPAIIMGYLLGSIPVSLLVARRHGVDLRVTGDGNPGAWNTLEQLGAPRAAPAFLGDAAKALVAGLIGYALGGWWVAFAGVAAAMVGHAFPAFAHLRGGKAVMAFVGGAFVLAPLAAAAALALCGAVTAATSFKYGARAGVFAYPALQLIFDPVERVIATGALMCLIGALFGIDALRSRSGRATRAAGAAPPA